MTDNYRCPSKQTGNFVARLADAVQLWPTGQLPR
jgi:hypothetical protein